MASENPNGFASTKELSATGILIRAFLVGSFLIVILRRSINSLAGAAVAAVLAIAIIFLIGRHYHKNYKSTEDRQMAGDNLYYLGLLFTLVSLILALLQLFVLDVDAEVNERANELIGNFGVALISTVAGIFARILFQNPIDASDSKSPPKDRGKTSDSPSPSTRVVGTGTGSQPEPLQAKEEPPPKYDKYDLPEVTEVVNFREELARLRLILREADDAFLHFSRICSEQSKNVVDHTDSLIRRQSEDFGKVAAHQLEQTSASLKSITDTFQTEMRALSGNFAEVVTEFKRHMTAEASEGMEVTSKAWSETSARLKSDGEKQIRAIYGNINGLLAGTEKSWSQLSDIGQMIAGSVAGMRANIESIQAMVKSSSDATLETNNLVKAMKNAQAELDFAGSTVAKSAAEVAESAREISGLQNALTTDMDQVRLEAVEEYRKVTAEISSQVNEQIESDSAKLKETLANAASDIDSRHKTGVETLDQAQQLSKQMTREAEEWKKLAEHTRKSLVSAAEHLADSVRKS